MRESQTAKEHQPVLIRRSLRELLSAYRKVSRVGVVEHQRRHARFGFHHETFGQLNADLFGPKQAEQSGLGFQIGTRWVAE